MTPEQLAAKLPGLISRSKRTAMQRATFHLLSIAKREVRVKSGNLRRNHTARVERGGDVGRVGVNAKYGRPLHEGYGPRIIRPRRKKALWGPGMRHPVKQVRHPGWRGDPWLARTARIGAAGVERELGRVAWFSGVR